MEAEDTADGKEVKAEPADGKEARGEREGTEATLAEAEAGRRGALRSGSR